MNKPLLTIDEFKAIYGVRRTKVYEMLDKGELRAVKIGRLTRIRAEDAQMWAEGLETYKPKDPASGHLPPDGGPLMTPRHRKPREVAQRNRSHGVSDEIIQWMIDAFHADRKPPSEVQGEPPHPSTPEAVQSPPPASPSPEVEQQAVPTAPAGTREDGHNEA